MKVKKDLKHDVAYIQLRKGRVAETLELRPGILFDLDKHGEVVGIEVMSLEKLAPIMVNSRRKKPAA